MIIYKNNVRQCQICGDVAHNVQGIGRHVLGLHKLSPQNYYNIYFGKKVCDWCGKETKFRSINKGYDNHCFECMEKSKHPTQDLYWKRVKGIEDQKEIERVKKVWFNENKADSKDFYIKRGFTEEEATLKVLKYRQDHNHIFKNNARNNFSKISQKLFIEIYNLLPSYIKDMKIYFATFLNITKQIIEPEYVDNKKNNEYLVFCRNAEQWKKLGKSGTALDFYIKDLNLIIEFDGVYWHNNETDKIRDEVLHDILGDVEIIHVKEKEYNAHKQEIICNILNTIERKYNERTKNKTNN